MHPMHNAPAPTLGEQVPPAIQEAVKDMIVRRMQRQEPAARIAALIEQNFHVRVDREQMLACWYERHPPATRTGPGQENESVPTRTEPADAAAHPQTNIDRGPVIRDAAPDASQAQPEHRPDKETVQLAADEAAEPLFTRLPCAETPDAAPAVTMTPDAAGAVSATRTGPGQKQESAAAPADEALPDDAREYIIAGMARREPVCMIAETVERKFGLVMDRDEIIACWRDRDAPPTRSGPSQSGTTRTGPGQKPESRPKLSDEVKAFIVQRFACYETPSRIAAAVRINFGIEIDRRRVFDYNPAGSRPPAQRWIDLHAATRAKFLRDVGEIGIAQKVVRLRMLDRFAQLAEDDHHYDRAARYLQQAARECGGFYEKHRAMAAA